MQHSASAEHRVEQSRLSLRQWRALAASSAHKRDLLRLLKGETSALTALALAHPESAPAAAQLIAACQDLAQRLKTPNHRDAA